jgi:hypothetical protein
VDGDPVNRKARQSDPWRQRREAARDRLRAEQTEDERERERARKDYAAFMKACAEQRKIAKTQAKIRRLNARILARHRKINRLQTEINDRARKG